MTDGVALHEYGLVTLRHRVGRMALDAHVLLMDDWRECVASTAVASRGESWRTYWHSPREEVAVHFWAKVLPGVKGVG